MTVRVRSGALAVACGLLVALAGPRIVAQQSAAGPVNQTPTFKVEVNYVEVDVIVTDRQGRFVRDLKKDDFEVLEDGKPQTINAFSTVDIPIEHAQQPLYATNPIEPDVKSNVRPFDGRMYVMVIDDLHTNPMRTQRVKLAAKQFIERRLGANDLMAIVHTSGRADASQEFTSNKRLLLAAADKVMGRKLTSATLNKTEDYWRMAGSRQAGDPTQQPRDFEDMERAYNAQTALRTLKNVADWFGSVHGRRKAILFVSEGIDYDIYNAFSGNTPTAVGSSLNNASGSNASAILSDMRDLIGAAQRADVAIYGIDPRGLTSLGDENIEVQAYPDDPTVGIGPNSLLEELRLSQDSLRVLSDETGGFAVVNRNDFATAYERIVEDNSSYYVLAYYPPSDKRDGRYHKIDVRVTRPGLTVRARKGYAAPKGKAPAPPKAAPGGSSAELRDALNSPIPLSGLTLNAFAAPFKGTAPNASVLFGAELRGRDLQLTPNDSVELSYIAVDSDGKVRGGNTETVTLNLRPQTRDLIRQTGLRLLNRADLPPGRYQVRVGARDGAGGNLGTVVYDLEVPDFSKARFAMSGIVLTSPSASAVPTAKPDESLKQVLPGPPVGLRDFPQNDDIALYTEIYDGDAGTPHKVDITTTVVTDEGRVMFKNDDERSSTEIQGKRGGYGYTTRVPLNELAPGSYVLKVEAKSRLGNGIGASREVQFTVTPPIGR